MATGLCWGLPNKMSTPFLPRGPQRVRSEVVSQLLPAPGHPLGLPWARCGLALASGVVRRVPFSPNRLGSTRRGCCEGRPYPV